jgi:ketosteroid isomerase-like protein
MNALTLDDVQSAADRFYAALNDLLQGDAEPILACWSHADDVSYMGPFGDQRIGWEAVSEAWREQLEMGIGGHVVPEHLHLVVGTDLAVTVGFEHGTGHQIDGRETGVDFRVTNVFRLEDGELKMIGHHTDRLT